MSLDRDQARDADAAAVEGKGASAPAVGWPLGNSALACLFEGRTRAAPRVAYAVPSGAALVAAGRMLQRATREESITALQEAVADGRWEDAAVRLNGFSVADIKQLAAGLSVIQMHETRGAVEQVLAGWPAQQTILDALDAGARAKGGFLRPGSKSFWAAYRQLSYDVIHGHEQQHAVWEFIGGSIGRDFGGNTCATRVSFALNYGGRPIPLGSFPTNDPAASFAGKRGDGRAYIIRTGDLQRYLTSSWGPPDATLATNLDAQHFNATLTGDRVAVFVGKEHAGVMRQGYGDPYVFGDPDVVPVVAWKLPDR